MKIINDIKAEPKLSQVYGRMGFKPARAGIPSSMEKMVEEAIFLGKDLARPKACFDYREMRLSSPDRLVVQDAFTIESDKVYNWMAGCHGIYLLAVTLGPDLDETVSKLSNSNEVTKAFLINAWGAEAAEAAIVELNQIIIREAGSNGFTTTRRYSPGYGDWHISAQKELLGTLKAEQIGIQLTEGYLMIPEKSVSAIIGVRQHDGSENK